MWLPLLDLYTGTLRGLRVRVCLLSVCVSFECLLPPGVKRMEDECGERKCGDEEVHRRMECYLRSHSVGGKKKVRRWKIKGEG